MTAPRIGLIVILVAAVVVTVAWFLQPVHAVRYAGAAGKASVTVALRLDGPDAPPSVTVELGNGVRVVAARLP